MLFFFFFLPLLLIILLSVEVPAPDDTGQTGVVVTHIKWVWISKTMLHVNSLSWGEDNVVKIKTQNQKEGVKIIWIGQTYVRAKDEMPGS